MKRQYDKQEITRILDKFMTGETSLEEEKMLAQYFRTNAVGDEWQKYKEMSPWKETPYWKDRRGKTARTATAVMRKIPRGIMIRIAGLAQAYGRPWKNRLMNRF